MKELIPAIESPDGLFHDGNPLTGELGTIVPAKWLNDMQGAMQATQSELLTVLDSAGLSADLDKKDQLLAAINYIVKQSDFVLPIGVPIPYPSVIPPLGFLKCNGAPFNKSAYPALATLYPNGVLPDLRGEFIRGWDDGRGVDTDRSLLSTQTDGVRTQSGSFWARQFKQRSSTATTSAGAVQNPAGIFSIEIDAATSGWDAVENTISGISSGANRMNLTVGNAPETRPRNISFLYIVRAA